MKVQNKRTFTRNKAPVIEELTTSDCFVNSVDSPCPLYKPTRVCSGYIHTYLCLSLYASTLYYPHSPKALCECVSVMRTVKGLVGRSLRQDDVLLFPSLRTSGKHEANNNLFAHVIQSRNRKALMA